MGLRKSKSPITPLGLLEAESEKSEKDFFWVNPMIPWWVKVAYRLRPQLFDKTTERKPTWCKWCGRKHDKSKVCKTLRKVEDLTVPPTKQDKDGNPVLNTRIAYYTTKDDSR